MKKIKYIQAEIGCCAEKIGCEMAPNTIANKNVWIKNNVIKTITANNSEQKL